MASVGVASLPQRSTEVAPARDAPGQLPSRRDAVFRRLLALSDLAAAGAALAVFSAIVGGGVGLAGYATVLLIVPIAKITGRYDHDELVLRKSTLDELPRLLSLAGGFALAWSVVMLIARVELERRGSSVPLLWGLTATFLVLGRSVARLIGQLAAPPERALIVGSARARTQLAHSLSSDPGARVEVVGFLPLEDERRASSSWGSRSRRRRRLTFDDLGTVVSELDVHRVFLIPTSADNDTMLEAVRRTAALGVNVSVVPRLLEVVGSAVEFDTVGGVTVLGVRRAGLTRSSRAVKRAVDIVGAAFGLLVVAPVAIFAAAAIKIDTPGPVFFTQRRVGRDGRTFQMIKFRSMVDGAEAQRAALRSRNETAGVFKLKLGPARDACRRAASPQFVR